MNVLLLTLLCLNISYVVNFYLPLVSSFICQAGFVLALGCYLPSPVCICIKCIEKKKKCRVTSGRKKVDTCVEDPTNNLEALARNLCPGPTS